MDDMLYRITGQWAITVIMQLAPPRTEMYVLFLVLIIK